MKMQVRNLVRLVETFCACASVLLALCLPTSAQTQADVTRSRTPSKAAIIVADSRTGCSMVSQAAEHSRSGDNMQLLFTAKLQNRPDGTKRRFQPRIARAPTSAAPTAKSRAKG
jgi:hypothetical protein